MAAVLVIVEDVVRNVRALRVADGAAGHEADWAGHQHPGGGAQRRVSHAGFVRGSRGRSQGQSRRDCRGEDRSQLFIGRLLK